MHFRVSMTTGGRAATGHAPARARVVEASSWLSALGQALDALDLVEGLERLACEVLPNGTVLARDGRSGQGFVVEPLRAPITALATGEPAASSAISDGACGAAPAEAPSEPLEAPSAPLEAGELGEDESGVLTLTDDDGVVGDPLGLADPAAGLPPALRVTESVTMRVPVVSPPVVVTATSAPEAALGLIRRAATVAGACQAALAVAQRFIPCEAGSVLLHQEHGLYVQAASGPRGGSLVGTVLPPDRGVVAVVLQRGVGLVVREADRDPRFEGHVDRQTGFRTRDLLCAPLRVAPKQGPEAPLLGVIQLLNSRPGAAFGGMELKGLMQIAEVLAARMTNGPPSR